MGFFKRNKTCNVYRFSRTGNADAYGDSPVYTNLSMGIFPASTSILAIYPGQLSYQLYEMFVYDAVTLQDGDKFIDVTNGDQYILRGVPRSFDLSFALQCVGEKIVGT